MKPLTAAAVMIATLAGSKPDVSTGPRKLPSALAQLIRRVEPYIGWTALGGVQRYAIPAAVVQCESRGDVAEQSHPYSSSGLYQIELSTWWAYGGRAFASFPFQASKWAQSVIARRILRGQGPGAWACAWAGSWS